MSRDKEHRQSEMPAGKKRIIGAVLCVVAVLLFVLAWQCVSTEQFRLYQSKRDIYTAAAAEYSAYQRESASAANSAMYGSLVDQWMLKADTANRYLLLHTIGAASLVLVGLLALVLGIRALVTAGRQSRKLPTPDEIRSQSQPVFRLGAGSAQTDEPKENE